MSFFLWYVSNSFKFETFCLKITLKQGGGPLEGAPLEKVRGFQPRGNIHFRRFVILPRQVSWVNIHLSDYHSSWKIWKICKSGSVNSFSHATEMKEKGSYAEQISTKTELVSRPLGDKMGYLSFNEKFWQCSDAIGFSRTSHTTYGLTKTLCLTLLIF